MPDRLELHRARVQKRIDLAHISASTALNPSIAARIDEGRFEDLPPGVYARSYVRTFARAVGIPPDEALAAVESYLPHTEDPLPSLRERAPKSPFEGFWAFVASQAKPYAALEALAATETRRRVAAAGIDAAILTSIGLVMVFGAAWASGAGLQRLLQLAGIELALMFSLPVGLYFILLDGLRVGTVGKVVCRSGTSARYGRGVRIRHWTYGSHTTGRLAPATPRRDAGRHDRGAESLALRSAPARR
jgi:hypothetical protein